MKNYMLILVAAALPASSATLTIDTCQSGYNLANGVVTCATGTPTPTPSPPPTPSPTPAPSPTPTPAPTGNLCAVNQLDSGLLQNTARQVDLDSQGGLNFVFPMNRGQSTSIQITTGPAGRSGNFILEAAESQVGKSVGKFLNISRSQCDFTYTQINAGSFCAGSASAGALQYRVEESGSATNYCSLRPYTTYYLNLRNEEAAYRSARGIDSCPDGECGLLFQFH